MAADKINPDHYQDLEKFSAIHIIAKWKLGFCLGTAVKYIQRAGHKKGETEIDDLKKAIWYIQRHIHELDPTQLDPAEHREWIHARIPSS